MKGNVDFSKPPKNMIYFYRTYHDLSQQELIDRINKVLGTDYKQKSLSRWEVSRSFIPSRVMVALSMIFDKSIEHLLGMTQIDSLPPLMPEYEELKANSVLE